MAATGSEQKTDMPSPLLLALWLALISGLAEGGFRLFQRYVLDQVILISPHVIWMAPVADLVWIGVPALALVLLRKTLPSLVRPGLIVAVLGTMAFLPLVLLYTSMHKVVAIFLAIALGFQLSRMVLPRSAGFARFMRVTVLPLLLTVVLAGGIVGGIRTWREKKALAALPAAKAGLPNVLLIIWDTVRSHSLSLYGYERPTTPFLQTFAPQGARFDLAMSTAPWTLPAHGSMFTGHRPLDLVRNVNLPLWDTMPTLAAVLTANGYSTAGFVANMAYTTEEHGLARDFAHYEDWSINPGNIFLASRIGRVLSDWKTFRDITGFWDQYGRKSAADVNRDFLDWAREQKDRPYFAFLNYFDAHQPYIAPAAYRNRFVRDSSGRYHPHFFHIKARFLQEPEFEWLRDNYDASIAYMDDEVGRLVAELERRGSLDHTIVIISSDHGEHLGDHGRLGHMNSLYRTVLQVPLIIRYPAKVAAGTVVGVPVSIRDFPQTIFDLAGIRDTIGFPGASLARFWNGTLPATAASAEPVLSEFATRKGRGPYSLLQGNYHYIGWQGQEKPPEFYDVNDPWETSQVTDSLQLAGVLGSFERWSEAFMGKQSLVKRAGPPTEEDEELPQ